MARICLIASSRFPIVEPFSGGLEAHTATLATRLRDRGHGVTVFAAPGSDPRLVERTLDVRPFTPSAASRRDVAATPAVWMAEHHAYLGLMLELAREGRDRFDVVHNNSLHHLPLAMAASTGLPFVTTLHTPPIAWLESAVDYAPADALYAAVSSHTRAAWAHSVDARVVLNGVDTDRFVPGPGGDRALWSGRLVPEKAPHLAIAAARRAGVPIDLVGPIQDPRYVAEHVEPLIADDARYLGHLGGTELVERIGRAAVAVVSPAWDEPYGLVAAEALSCGTPVAAFDRGALAEIVDPTCGVLAAPDDVDALADAIVRARRLNRAAARHRAVTACSVDRMVDGYEALYRELVGECRVA